MSTSNIPEKTKIILWGLAAGRCEYDGCNEKLYEDPLTRSKFNQSYIAHIIADESGGPRGDVILSPKLSKEISNLMLLCDRHHRLIDKQDVAGHSVERLTNMKQKHEERIELLTTIKDEKRSNIVLYGSNIGKHDSSLNLNCAQEGLIPFRFPAEASCIELSLKNNAKEDHNADFWRTEVENLELLFDRKITQQRAERPIKHYSIFGLADQPLLIKLGTLFGDIYPADVYQLKKEPKSTWAWLEDDLSSVKYEVNKPENKTDTVALKFSLSAKISDQRVKKVLGENCSIWELTVANPHNDFIRKKEHLSEYRTIVRSLLDEIKLFHGEDVKLHIFPAMPVSTSVELGRVWNPKSQLPLVLYDQNRKTDGFSYAFEIINS
jgi:SMODS-associated and fused to various effectors sensor domain